MPDPDMVILKQSLAVGVAGFVGAVARFYVQKAFGRALPALNFPLGVLFINVTGSFVLGWFLTLVGDRWAVGETTRLAVAVGFVGSYTTFSTLMYDTVALSWGGHFWRAVLNLALSLALGIVAVRLGVVCAKRF